MPSRLRKYVPAFLLAALAGSVAMSAACRGADSELSPTSPKPVGAAAVITAEPETIAPQFLTDASCRIRRPFSARMRLIIRSLRGRALRVRSVGFTFVDRFGARAVPLVVPFPPAQFPPTPFQGGGSPIPFPTTSPIPLPGMASFDALAVAADTSFVLPFALQFGCGVLADGTIDGLIETSDSWGSVDVARVSARVVE